MLVFFPVNAMRRNGSLDSQGCSNTVCVPVPLTGTVQQSGAASVPVHTVVMPAWWTYCAGSIQVFILLSFVCVSPLLSAVRCYRPQVFVYLGDAHPTSYSRMLSMAVPVECQSLAFCAAS